MSDSHAHPIAVSVPDSTAVPPGENPGEAPDPALIADLVSANHILFDQGVVDAFGHVSVRHDKRPDRFLLARNMAPGAVTADDIVEFDLDGNPVNAKGRRVYLERFIHGELFRRRPDVMSVVHSHSHAIVPLSVVKDVQAARAVPHGRLHRAGRAGVRDPRGRRRRHGPADQRQRAGPGPGGEVRPDGHRADARPRLHRGGAVDPAARSTARCTPS